MWSEEVRVSMDKGGEYECVSEFRVRQGKKREGTDVEEGEYRQRRLKRGRGERGRILGQRRQMVMRSRRSS